MQNRCFERSVSSVVQTIDSSVITASKKKGKTYPKNVVKDDAKEWERWTVNQLNKSFETKKKQFSRLSAKREAQSNIVSFIRNDDVRQLFSLSSAIAQNTVRDARNAVSPEFFAIVLKYCALLFEKDYRLKTVDEWRSIVYSAVNFLSRVPAVNFLSRVPLNDDLTTTGFGYALRSLKAFLNKFSQELNMPNITPDLESCQNKLDSAVASRKEFGTNQLIFEMTNYDSLAMMTGKGFQEIAKKHNADASNYDKEVDLVASLRYKRISPNYTSPFSIPQRSKEDYVKMFKAQLESELGGYLKVKNFERKSTLEPMEEVIKKMKWRESIEEELRRWAKTIKEPQLKSTLTNLDYKGCSTALLDVVKCMLSQGQKLFVVADFESALSAAVLNFCYRSFLEKVQVSADKVITNVFTSFAEYFTNDLLPQKYTLREWWMHCCQIADKVITNVFTSFAEYFTNDLLPQKYTLREWWMHCCQIGNVDPEISLPLTDFRLFLKPKIGGILANMVMSSCRFVENGNVVHGMFYQKVMQEEETLAFEKKVDINKMIRIHPTIMKKIGLHEFEYMLFPHEYLPLKVPPRPWLDAGKNGPFFTRPSKIIRILPEYRDIDVNAEFKERLEKDSSARPVIDALNDLGTTPWIINGSMLDVLTEIFNMCNNKEKEELLSTLSVPLHSSTIEIPQYADVFGDRKSDTVTSEEWREFYKKTTGAIKKKNEMNSLWCWLHYRISLARHYRNDVLYFPHNMDFRGRVYPISPHLNHMGDDINRCILKFAKGKKLGKRGLYWLKLHIVNITGLLKRKSISERILYAEEHLDQILDSANNPLSGQRWWLKSDEPWQTLAACIELRDALKSGDPENFVSHLPIHQDGSCNGLQHYAALGRDLQGAAEVNLLPCELPADVYSSVAARVEEKRIEDEHNVHSPNHEIAVKLRKFLPQVLPRKVIKQTVMTTVYGVTPYGARQQIKRQLKALDDADTDSAEVDLFSKW
uniref:DNA-directed RNA polymerase n=1 Tax=Panagrolaimus sp. JU765 TaxID=591449 RepID=A0AC34QL68_9BILA